jgi:ureidoglycolate lyase
MNGPGRDGIRIEPLSAEAFAEFGEVIEATATARHYPINQGTTMRYHRLAAVQTLGDGAEAIISIFRGQRFQLPLTIQTMERHPLGSQAFMPLAGQRFLVVVAAGGERPDPTRLHAFITNGAQGVNYRNGTWHHALLNLADASDFLVVDRGGPGHNCDECLLPAPVTIHA